MGAILNGKANEIAVDRNVYGIAVDGNAIAVVENGIAVVGDEIAVVGNGIADDGIRNGIPDDRFDGKTHVGDGFGDADGRKGLTRRRRTGFSKSKRAAKTSRIGFQDSNVTVTMVAVEVGLIPNWCMEQPYCDGSDHALD